MAGIVRGIFCIGTVILGILIHVCILCKRKNKKNKCRTCVEAKVIQSLKYKDSMFYTALVRFEHEGECVEAETFTASDYPYVTGSKIKIRYNEENPTMCYDIGNKGQDFDINIELIIENYIFVFGMIVLVIVLLLSYSNL